MINNNYNNAKYILNVIQWYTRLDVKTALVEQLQNRELALIDKDDSEREAGKKRSNRYNYAINEKMIAGTFYFCGVITNPTFYNIYKSIATYYSTIGITNKREWSINHTKKITKYDLVIDIDPLENNEKGIIEAKEGALLVVELYDELDIPYSIKFSGKGFHITTDGNDIKDSTDVSFLMTDENNVYKLCKSIQDKLKEKCSCLIDDKINEPNRLIKLCYTLSLYPETSDIRVCHPINSYEELENFETKNALIENFHPTPDPLNKVWNFETKQNITYKEKTFNKGGNFYNLIEYLELNEQWLKH